MILWLIAMQVLLPYGAKFHIVDLAPHCNRVLSTNWDEKDSFAGLVAGERWLFGVPFFIVDPNLNEGKIAIRDATVAVNAPASFLFALVANAEKEAKVVLEFSDGTKQVASLAGAIPAIIAHPPLYRWHLDMVAIKVRDGMADAKRVIKRIRVEGVDLLALTLSTHSEAELRETFEALKRQAKLCQQEEAMKAQLQKLHDVLAPLKGRIAILPTPPPESSQSHPLFITLSKAGLTEYCVMLSPTQLVDESVFNAHNFPVALYLSGERFYYTVNRNNDGADALKRFLRDGGLLLVFPSLSFPFYYDERGKVIGNADAFGLPVRQGWEEPPAGVKLHFHCNQKQSIVTDLPATFPFPSEGDLRWRPIVKPKGEEGVDFVYTPLLTLLDEKGNSYGDAVAVLEYQGGEFGLGRLVYVWHTIWETEVALPLLTGLLKWTSKTVQEKPPIAHAVVYRTHAPLRIDGELDEPDWQVAQKLVLSDIKGRSAPQTIARLLWDSTYLYIAFECADDDVWATKNKRDEFLWEEEVVEVFIDPDGDGRNYYELQVNPLNAQTDLLIPDPVEGVKDAKRNAKWDCAGWLSAVKVRGTVNRRDDKDIGWTVEMAIPLSELLRQTLNAPSSGTEWRINLYRIERPRGREKEPLLLSWSKCIVWFHEPERFGRITFAGNPCADDFNLYPDGSDGHPTWTPLQGEWQMKGGIYYGTDGGSDGWIALGSKIGFDWWRNYEVTVRFKVQEFGSNWRDGFWLAFRFLNRDNAYSLNFYQGQGGVVQLHKICEGISTGDENPLAVAKWKPDNEWHEVTVRVEGNSITASLDGQQLFSIVDKNLNGVPALERGAIVISPRRWSKSQGHTKIAISKVVVKLLP